LVIDETDLDSESVVGEECHIISALPKGPRFDENYPQDKIDDISNLILLCRIHHKQIDDQYETYTRPLLTSIKENHENWVESKLKDHESIPPVRIKRYRDKIPAQLPPITSGRDLLNLASHCHSSYQTFPDDLSEEEVEQVGHFLQNLRDWADLSGDIEPLDQVRAAKSLDDDIKGLLASGFIVFAAIEKQTLVGGVGGPSDFRALHITVARESDPNIVLNQPENGPKA
jgi:hypothetical protein